ncbi:MAG: carbohydrate ABC transporter permease [Clostridia bacterium]|nr:carbohydrate ABC transporter permease [Clostridia bacterium]
MIGKVVRTVVMSLLALIVITPLLMTLFGSFMGSDELFAHISPVLPSGAGQATLLLYPRIPSLTQYIALLFDNGVFLTMFWNSMRIVVLILMGQMVVGTLAAWGFASYRFRFSQALFMGYIALMMMPFQVTLVPTYLTLERFKLIDTVYAVILPGIFTTFSVFLLRQFFRAVPRSLLEAARIDGASEPMVFFRVGIPLAVPGIASMLTLSFLDNWNLIEQPMTYLKTEALHPLSLYLMRIGSSNADVAMAASVLTLLPALMLFFFCESYLVEGIQLTGIKE